MFDFLRLVDTAAKLIPLGWAPLTLSFDRDASKTFWYTFDADDNRNITPYQTRRRWSLSIFSICPTIYAAYDAKILAATIYAYHGAVRRWIRLEDRAGGVFPGPGVQRDVTDFLKTFPPIPDKDIGDGKSEAVRIGKVGVFEYSLSSEYAFSSRAWAPAAMATTCRSPLFYTSTRSTCTLPVWFQR